MMQFTKSQSTTIEIADPKLGDLNSMFFLLRHALFDHYTCKSEHHLDRETNRLQHSLATINLLNLWCFLLDLEFSV
ncbi:hypothetical protein SDJN03_12132, partial [Cucurbita argyrosperma subsp. sororia]